MTAYRRNILVGSTVLLGLLILAWMIIQFGEAIASPFAAPSLPVTFVSDRADGVAPGSPIIYRGLNVGRVTDVKLSEDGEEVMVGASINVQRPIPKNVIATIRSTSLVGSGSAIMLDIAGQKPHGKVEAGEKIQAVFVGLDLIPPAFTTLSEQAAVAIRNFNDLKVLQNANDKITRVGESIDRFNALLGDKEMTGDIRATLANARQTTEQVKAIVARVSGKLDPILSDAGAATSSAKLAAGSARELVDDAQKRLRTTTDNLNDRLAQASVAMNSINSILTKVNRGDGTAGKLVNDPKAYQALTDSLQLLSATIADTKRLVEQWEQEGVSFKLR